MTPAGGPPPDDERVYDCPPGRAAPARDPRAWPPTRRWPNRCDGAPVPRHLQAPPFDLEQRSTVWATALTPRPRSVGTSVRRSERARIIGDLTSPNTTSGAIPAERRLRW